MLISNLPHGAVQRAHQIIYDKLGDIGGDILTTIKEDPIFATRIALMLAREHAQASKDQDPVRRIMGANYIGRFEAGFLLRIAQKDLQAPVPFSKEELQECRDSHVLCLVPPWSIRQVLNRLGPGFLPEGSSKGWLNGPVGYARPVQAEWYLIPKNYAVMLGMERKPSAPVLFYLLVMHLIATGERLGENMPWMPTTDCNRPPYRVHFGWKDGGIECCEISKE